MTGSRWIGRYQKLQAETGLLLDRGIRFTPVIGAIPIKRSMPNSMSNRGSDKQSCRNPNFVATELR
jgi:hypothetical protein